MFYFHYVFIPQQTDIHNDKWMDNELATITHISTYICSIIPVQVRVHFSKFKAT